MNEKSFRLLIRAFELILVIIAILLLLRLGMARRAGG